MLLSIASVALANTKTDTIVYVRPVIVEEVKPETETEKIERLIRETFPDAPIMMEVARCESGLRNVPSKTGDWGPFQVNQVHTKRLQELGLDRTVIEDNIKYARLLYDESGTQHWYMSKHCWSK